MNTARTERLLDQAFKEVLGSRPITLPMLAIPAMYREARRLIATGVDRIEAARKAIEMYEVKQPGVDQATKENE